VSVVQGERIGQPGRLALEAAQAKYGMVAKLKLLPFNGRFFMLVGQMSRIPVLI